MRTVGPTDHFGLKAAVGDAIGKAIGNSMARCMTSGREGGSGGLRAGAYRFSAL
jgi:hypothetical protein